MKTQQVTLNRGIYRWLLALIFIIGAGAANAATVQIANCNPNNFLANLWQDLLGRAITPAEKVTLLNFINRGGSRYQVALILMNSVEYRTRLTQGLYQQFLERDATESEVSAVLTALQQGATTDQIIVLILGSNEYYQNRGHGTINGFLEQIYNDLLERPIDDSARAAFTSLLSNGFSRQQIIQTLLSSSEYRAIQVKGFYRIYLGRDAVDADISFFVNLWQQGATREQIIALIVGSQEYCELSRRHPHGHRQ